MAYSRAAQAGSANPCGRYEKAATAKHHFDLLPGWLLKGSDARSAPGADGCGSVMTSIADSLKECQAECSANLQCNAINYQSSTAVCELVTCPDKSNPATVNVAGWMMLTYTKPADPPPHWTVGEWSPCVNKLSLIHI